MNFERVEQTDIRSLSRLIDISAGNLIDLVSDGEFYPASFKERQRSDHRKEA